MREWSLKLHLLDEEGNERPADVFTKVVYNLHPTFENPTQSALSPIHLLLYQSLLFCDLNMC